MSSPLLHRHSCLITAHAHMSLRRPIVLTYWRPVSLERACLWHGHGDIVGRVLVC
jgi:hypothetical protein